MKSATLGLILLGCAAVALPATPRSPVVRSAPILVRIHESCQKHYGARIESALLVASSYWAERGHPPLEFTRSHFSVPVACPTKWIGYTDNVKGRASMWHADILYDGKAVDYEGCERPNWHLSRVVTHEIGHVHGLGHSTGIMDPYAASVCRAP